MRIALVSGPNIPVPPAQYGGTEQVIYYLIKGLLEMGHEPILLGAPESNVECRVIPISESPLYYPSRKKDIVEHEKLEALAKRTTKRKLRELLPDIDVIHSHGFDLLPFKDFPSVTTIHHMIEFQHVDYFKKRKNLQYVSISHSQQESFSEIDYVGNVYNGEDPSRFPVVATPENYVCFLGRFDRDKNPHIAIQLAISMGIKIKLAGKIDYKGEGYFEEEVEKYFSHPLVEYLGEVGFKEKIELLSRAKCNLHPTNFREPFGLTVLEAAYCGTPTLATARGSMPELIEIERTGMLVEDFIEGRHYIERCFEMDREYIAGRSRQLFNYQTMTKGYLNAYEQAIELAESRKQRPRLLSRLKDAFSTKNRI
jgi:glycosyltransferase involved in cell wall biosynthesis